MYRSLMLNHSFSPRLSPAMLKFPVQSMFCIIRIIPESPSLEAPGCLLLVATPLIISHLRSHPIGLKSSQLASRPHLHPPLPPSLLVFGVTSYLVTMGGRTVLMLCETPLDNHGGTVIISISRLFIFPACDLRWLLVMETGPCGPQNTARCKSPCLSTSLTRRARVGGSAVIGQSAHTQRGL